MLFAACPMRQLFSFLFLQEMDGSVLEINLNFSPPKDKTFSN